MHDSTAPQIKHILPDAPVTRSAALPMSHVCQGMLYSHAFPQLRLSLRRLLAFPQLLQQGFIRMNAHAVSEALVEQRSRNAHWAQVAAGNLTTPPGSKGIVSPPGQRNVCRSQSS